MVLSRSHRRNVPDAALFFVNSRKDQDKKMSAFKKFAGDSLVYDLFPVIDSLEMAFDNEGWKKVDKTWQDGIKCLYNQFISVLKNHNVEQLEPSGKKFDLQEHESLGEIDSKSKGEDGVVIEYVRRGYKINGKVLTYGINLCFYFIKIHLSFPLLKFFLLVFLALFELLSVG